MWLAQRSRITYAFVLLVVLSAGCRSTASSPTQEIIVDEALGQVFAGQDACFVLYDAGQQRTTYYNRERCGERFLPASTFKILNSLIALESGVIADENEVIPWDGTPYAVTAWNRDQTLRTAIRDSVVWAYQELARRVGAERMQDYVQAAGYGNADISGNIDSFWLDGALRISADEQIDFLQRLYTDELPFSQRNLDIVKDILILEQTDSYTLRGKTGSVQRAATHTGWFIGYLESGGDVYFFATNFDHENPNGLTAGETAKRITRQILVEMGLLP